MQRLLAWWRFRRIRRTGMAVARAFGEAGDEAQRLTFAFHGAFEGHECPYCRAVWTALEAEPGLNERLREAEADMAAGRWYYGQTPNSDWPKNGPQA